MTNTLAPNTQPHAHSVNPDQRPGGGPAAFGPRSRVEAITFFEQTIGGLYEKDYGDFMRKCMVYIERLRADLSTTPEKAEALKVVAHMKMYTCYATDFDMENTRLRLLRDAQSLR